MDKKRLLAIAVSSILAATAMAGFAEGAITEPIVVNDGESASIKGKVEVEVERGSAVEVAGTPGTGTSATIKGSVSVTGDYSAAITVQDGEVTVKGNIEASGEKGYGIHQSGSEATVTGDIIVDGDSIGGINQENSTAIVTGNISASGRNSAAINQTGSSALVHGDITTTGEKTNGILNWQGSDIQLDGDLDVSGDNSAGILSYENADATISGDIDVTGDSGYGIYQMDACNASVGGSISVTGDEALGIFQYKECSVEVGGDITVEGDGVNGIWQSESSAEVSGDLTVTGSGIALDQRRGSAVVDGSISMINTSDDEEQASYAVDTFMSDLYVSGNVTQTGIGEGAIHINALSTEWDLYEDESPDHEIVVEGTVYGSNAAIYITNDYEGQDVIPVLVVGGLESGTDTLIASNYLSDEQIEQLLTESIRYIISAKDMDIEGADSYTTANGTTYDVVKQGGELTLTPVIKNGRKLKSIDFGEYAADVVDNGDGSYTITVARGGNLYFTVYTSSIAKNTKKETTGTIGVGSRVKLAGSDWIITDIAENGDLTLASVADFTEEQLADLQALLPELLTENELARVRSDENGVPCVAQIDEAVADTYFGGNTDHISIVADPAILAAA